MDTSDQNPVDTVRTERHGFRVSDDLADMPVSDAELDVIEAFLMGQFRAVMAGKGLRQSMLCQRRTRNRRKPVLRSACLPGSEAKA